MLVVYVDLNASPLARTTAITGKFAGFVGASHFVGRTAEQVAFKVQKKLTFSEVVTESATTAVLAAGLVAPAIAGGVVVGSTIDRRHDADHYVCICKHNLRANLLSSSLNQDDLYRKLYKLKRFQELYKRPSDFSEIVSAGLGVIPMALLPVNMIALFAHYPQFFTTALVLSYWIAGAGLVKETLHERALKKVIKQIDTEVWNDVQKDIQTLMHVDYLIGQLRDKKEEKEKLLKKMAYNPKTNQVGYCHFDERGEPVFHDDAIKRVEKDMQEFIWDQVDKLCPDFMSKVKEK